MRVISSPLAQAGTLLAAAGVCALVSNALSGPARRLPWLGRPMAADSVPGQAATITPAPAPPVKTPWAEPDPSRPLREIQPEDAWALFQAKAPFLDARRHSDYAEGHVAGAWSMSVWESGVDERITEFEALAGPASASPIVLYCSGGGCEDSHLLASRLTALGYRNLLVYQAGYPDWVKRGHPVARGGAR